MFNYGSYPKQIGKRQITKMLLLGIIPLVMAIAGCAIFEGAVTAPEPTVPNGTYTFFPRLQAMTAGADEDVYLDRIVVRGGYFSAYITDTPSGSGNWLMWGNRWNHNWPQNVKLQDLDRPSRAYTAVRGGTNDASTERFFSFENISGKRFQLTYESVQPFSTFDEINIDSAEFEP